MNGGILWQDHPTECFRCWRQNIKTQVRRLPCHGPACTSPSFPEVISTFHVIKSDLVKKGHDTDIKGRPTDVAKSIVKMLTNDQDSEEAVLFGRLDSVKPLIDALNCIYSAAHKAQDVTLKSHEPQGGLRFTVEEAGCLLASVILPRRAFCEFRCRDADMRIRLNLSLLLECLNIFGSSSAERFGATVQLRYGGEGRPLVVRLRDGDADSVCELTTLHVGEDVETDFQFHAHEMVNMAVVDSEAVRDALGELDYGGATTAELRLAPERPRFGFSSPAWTVGLDAGDEGEREEAVCTVELADPSDRRTDTFQAFQSKRMQCATYKLEHLGRCVKALGMSESCKVEMNSEGMVSIMCRMKGGGNGVDSATERSRAGMLDRCFVEFVVVAQEIEEDEEEQPAVGNAVEMVGVSAEDDDRHAEIASSLN